MKVKATVPIELQNAGDCARAAQEVTEMKCGLAFAMFNLREDRTGKAGAKPIPMATVRAGLMTTGRDPRLQAYVGESFKKELRPIAAAARRIAGRLDKNKTDIARKDAPALLAEIEKVASKLSDVWDRVDKSCHKLKK